MPKPRASGSDCAAVIAAARTAAASIQAGNTRPDAIIALTKVLQQCPPSFPRPTDCFGMMVDAQSKVRTNPDYSKRRAQQAVDCYSGSNDRPQVAQPQSPEAPIFHYFYINGVNTPECGHPRSEPNDPGGTYCYEYGKVNSTLVHTTTVVQDETDIMEPYFHNRSGKDQALANLFGICSSQSRAQNARQKEDVGSLLVAIACWAQQQWSGGGLAWGDMIECLAQSLKVTGIGFTKREIEVIQVADRIHQIFLQELQAPPQNRRPHYFIIVAHSQGNFFAEGIAYRLLNPDPNTYGERGPFIFHNRLGIISLGSPTQYDSLPSDFINNQLRHITRADDAIHILDLLSAYGFLSKRPWERSQDVAALWPWRNGQLDWTFKTFAGVKQVWQFMQQGLPALATPFMNAHLLDNYLTDPTATPAILTGTQREIPQNLANMLNIYATSSSDAHFQTPTGTPVLSIVQQNVRNLKKYLLAIAKVNSVTVQQSR